MPQWNKSTARVLSRLRDFSWPTVQWQPTDREKGCIHRVWVFVGVRLEEYDKNWDFVGAGLPKSEKLALRAGVRERLLTVFDEAAFSEDADEANGALGSFQRQHLLDWGDRLLAADAAAHAAGPTVTDDDSTGLDTAISVVLAKLPEETRLIVEGIVEEAAAKGYGSAKRRSTHAKLQRARWSRCERQDGHGPHDRNHGPRSRRVEKGKKVSGPIN